MKKIFALLLAAVMCVSLAACGGSNGESSKTEVLTVDNIDSYLDVNAKVESCTIDEGDLGLTSKGDAEIIIETQNDSGAKFEKATIWCEIRVLGGRKYGWEFVSGNTPSEDRGNSGLYSNDNYREVKIELPYDGEESITEKLKLAFYTEDDRAIVAELQDSQIFVEIIDVIGTVVVED
ncbi:MAG: hypothetical protein IJC89_00760 [Clostridia bacterium]|nr:hypothetical protein [Clostridia bacterium]